MDEEYRVYLRGCQRRGEVALNVNQWYNQKEKEKKKDEDMDDWLLEEVD